MRKELGKVFKKAFGIASLVFLATVNVEAGEKVAKIYIDQSTSMAPLRNYTTKHVQKLENLLENQGFEVELVGFGETIRELPSIEDYSPSEEDTNYGLVFDNLSNQQNALVFFVSDGKLPASRISELPSLINKAKKLKDSGILICADSALREPSKILTSLATVVKPFGKEEELVSECIKRYGKLLEAIGKKDEDNNNNNEKLEKDSVLKIKDVEEAGFRKKVGVKKEGGNIVINIYGNQ